MRSLHLLRFSREPVAPPVRFYHLCRLHNRLVARDPDPPFYASSGSSLSILTPFLASPNPTVPAPRTTADPATAISQPRGTFQSTYIPLRFHDRDFQPFATCYRRPPIRRVFLAAFGANYALINRLSLPDAFLRLWSKRNFRRENRFASDLSRRKFP